MRMAAMKKAKTNQNDGYYITNIELLLSVDVSQMNIFWICDENDIMYVYVYIVYVQGAACKLISKQCWFDQFAFDQFKILPRENLNVSDYSWKSQAE